MVFLVLGVARVLKVHTHEQGENGGWLLLVFTAAEQALAI
jgi:hypothetical protein